MSEAKLRRWGLEEFLAWKERQPTNYELVDGRPVMMTGIALGLADICESLGFEDGTEPCSNTGW